MSKNEVLIMYNMRRTTRELRLPSQPVRLSKEELTASRAGMIGCFPSPELYEPEEDLIPVRRPTRVTKMNVPTHAEVGV